MDPKKSIGFKETIGWYDDNAQQYATKLSTDVPYEAINMFLLNLPPSPSILEAGCAAGRESKVFIERGAKITGVDLSENLLNIAKRDNPQGEYVKANFLNLSFQDSTFDGVWAHASILHLETVDEVMIALREFNRVLKPGGILFVGVKMQSGDEKTAIVTDSLSNADRFFQYFTESEMRELIGKANFEVEKVTFGEDGHGRKEVKWIRVIAKKL